MSDVDYLNVMEVISITPLSSFGTTRASLQSLSDLGADRVNGYTTDFTEGTSGPVELYRVSLQVIGPGTAYITIAPTTESKFAASTPHGLKIGHTNSNGDPNSTVYPAALSVVATAAGDINGDGWVDFTDYSILGDQWQQIPGVPSADIYPDGGDNIVDSDDLELLTGQWLMHVVLSADFSGNYEVDFEDFAVFALQWMEPPGTPSADIYPPEGDNIVDIYVLDEFSIQWLEGK